MKTLPIKHDGISVLHQYSKDASGLWTVERIRYLLKYPNWSIVTDMIQSTRNYDIGLSIASSLFLDSFRFKDELKDDEFDRLQFLSAMFLLEMFDKADRWEAYLIWFDFLRNHLNIYLRYDQNFSRHNDEGIEEFIDNRGDEYRWVSNMFLYNRRRRTIERKWDRLQNGKSYKSDLHHGKNELSDEDISNRIIKIVSTYDEKMRATEFWQSFWKKQ